MRKDKRSELSRLEVILMDTIHDNCVLENLEFESIEAEQKKQIIKKVMTECKRCVIGALYEDFEGALYGFDLADEGLYLSYKGYEFMLRHKMELEKLNYYSCEYSCAVTPQIRQTGNRLSGNAGTAYASLLA